MENKTILFCRAHLKFQKKRARRILVERASPPCKRTEQELSFLADVSLWISSTRLDSGWAAHNVDSYTAVISSFFFRKFRPKEYVATDFVSISFIFEILLWQNLEIRFKVVKFAFTQRWNGILCVISYVAMYCHVLLRRTCLPASISKTVIAVSL